MRKKFKVGFRTTEQKSRIMNNLKAIPKDQEILSVLLHKLSSSAYKLGMIEDRPPLRFRIWNSKLAGTRYVAITYVTGGINNQPHAIVVNIEIIDM